jgi:hypothetical protein
MEPDRACQRCAGDIRWIDAWHACPEGCAYCAECAEELGGSCANGCGTLSRRASLARPLPTAPP